MSVIETDIAEWRAAVTRGGAVAPADADELESHLREQVSELTASGLSEDEAFLVAVKRLGQVDLITAEFAREHSERLWKQLVLDHGEAPEQARASFGRTAAVAAAAALLIQLLRLATTVPGAQEWRFALDLGFFLVVPLAVYFAVSRAVPRRVLVVVGAAVVALAALGGALVITVFGGDDGAAAAAGCTTRTFPAQAAEHVEAPKEGFEYNSFPPTSGPHHPIPAPFGVYDEPVEQFRLVHNLEHGGLVIQYGPRVPRQEVDELLEWYRDDPNGIVVAPLPALGNKIALAAWKLDPDEARRNPRAEGEGVLMTCSSFDEGAFDDFADEHAFQGPEAFPREQLTPGAS